MSKPATGYVRQRKNGLWEGQYTFHREKRSIYGQTREEVTQELERIIHSIEDGNYVRPNQHTLISWLRDWVKTYAKPTLRPSTSTTMSSLLNGTLQESWATPICATSLPGCCKTSLTAS